MPLPTEEEEDSSVDENENNDDMEYDYTDAEYGKTNSKTTSQKNNIYEELNENSNSAFLDVISDMVATGHSDGHQPDNLLMEIKGYKFAQNKVNQLFFVNFFFIFL